MTHLVDQELIREIIETVVDAVDQRRQREERVRRELEPSHSKWIGSAPAWLSLIISVGVGIFMLGSLVGDVAIAKTDSSEAKTTIQQMKIEQAKMQENLNYLVEAEKRRSGR